MPSSSAGPTHRQFCFGKKFRCPGYVACLLALSAWGFHATWGNSIMDGTLKRNLDFVRASPAVLPGTSEPLRRQYTGLPPIDFWLQIMVVFWWQAVDGSEPVTSATGIYFLGQMLSVWTLVYSEGICMGKQKHILQRTLLWVLLMQYLAFAGVAPLYFLLHLETKTPELPRLTSLESVNVHHSLRVLPASILLGFVAPSIAVGTKAPEYTSYSGKQICVAIWIMYPCWVAGFHTLLVRADIQVFTGDNPESKVELDGKVTMEITRKWLYVPALVGSTFVHLAIVAVSLSSMVLPRTIASEVPSDLRFLAFLRPLSSCEVSTIGQGVRRFLQWDQVIGYTALLLWVVGLQRDRLESSSLGTWARILTQLCIATVTLGPGSAAVLFVWGQDQEGLVPSRHEKSMEKVAFGVT